MDELELLRAYRRNAAVPNPVARQAARDRLAWLVAHDPAAAAAAPPPLGSTPAPKPPTARLLGRADAHPTAAALLITMLAAVAAVAMALRVTLPLIVAVTCAIATTCAVLSLGRSLTEPLTGRMRAGSRLAISPTRGALTATMAAAISAVVVVAVMRNDTRPQATSPDRLPDSVASSLPPARPAYADAFRRVAFSSNRYVVASAGDDGIVRVWNLRARSAVGRPLRGQIGRVVGVAFSPDGHKLVTAGNDGTIRVWDVRARRPLTPALHAG